ncbi:MAG: pyridoxal-phosphate dependent enzyme [Myxococcaceae bacterium]|nr:pyridoxal-phosphate dependent enzyme [Myxococcaceae bacterium]
MPEAPVKSFGAITELVGNTPLVELKSFARETPGVRIFAKCEFYNPGGSVKDRAGLQMLKDAKVPEGKTIIDSTSGNTGIALAWIGAALGLKVALVMPSNVSAARKRITKAYGAQLIFSDPLEGSDGAIRHARKLIEAEPDRYHYLDQYSNASNPRAHYLTTAPEIWAQTAGKVTHFVAGIGTTGTVIGTGRRLKELNPKVQIIALEPLEPMHGLEGLKHLPTSIVPHIYDEKVHDEKLSVSTDAGWDMSERLLKDEGLSLGHSSGAAAAGALTVAKRLVAAKREGTIVTVFPDRADRYFEPKRWEKSFQWP